MIGTRIEARAYSGYGLDVLFFVTLPAIFCFVTFLTVAGGMWFGIGCAVIAVILLWLPHNTRKKAVADFQHALDSIKLHGNRLPEPTPQRKQLKKPTHRPRRSKRRW